MNLTVEIPDDPAGRLSAARGDCHAVRSKRLPLGNTSANSLPNPNCNEFWV